MFILPEEQMRLDPLFAELRQLVKKYYIRKARDITISLCSLSFTAAIAIIFKKFLTSPLWTPLLLCIIVNAIYFFIYSGMEKHPSDKEMKRRILDIMRISVTIASRRYVVDGIQILSGSGGIELYREFVGYFPKMKSLALRMIVS